jgi:hypothetical protein
VTEFYNRWMAVRCAWGRALSSTPLTKLTGPQRWPTVYDLAAAEPEVRLSVCPSVSLAMCGAGGVSVCLPVCVSACLCGAIHRWGW